MGPSRFYDQNDSWEDDDEMRRILFQDEPWRPASQASSRGSFVPDSPQQTTPTTTANTANRFAALAMHDTATMHDAGPTTAAPAAAAASCVASEPTQNNRKTQSGCPKPLFSSITVCDITTPADTLASTASAAAAPGAALKPATIVTPTDTKLRRKGSGAGRGRKHCPACNNSMGARQRTCPNSKCQFDTLANRSAVKLKPAAKPDAANRPSKCFPGPGYKFCTACQRKIPARSIVCPCGHNTRSLPPGAGPGPKPTHSKGKGKQRAPARSRSRSKSRSPGVTSTTWGKRTVAAQRAAQKSSSTSPFKRSDFMIPATVPVPALLAPVRPPAGPAPEVVDYPTNALVAENKALDNHVASIAALLTRNSSGVLDALPALPLTEPDTRLPTDAAAYHSVLLSSIDPLARDLPAATHIQKHLAPLYQHEPDPHVQLCADMLAGLCPETALILTPRMGSGHQQNTHAAVCVALCEVNKKAVEYFDKGDDRLLSLVWCMLPLALLMHDPRGAPRLDKHTPAYNRRCTLHRIAAIRRHGFSAIAALLLDWRAVAALRALEPNPNVEIDPATKISIVAGLIARGVPLGACLERVNAAPTTASDTDTIAIQFRLQHPADASDSDPELPDPGSFDPASLPAAELRKMLPTGAACPAPFTLPNQFDEETINGYTYDDIQQAMCQTLRSVDGGASAFVDGATPASQKLFLTHADGWLTCFELVRAIDSDNMRSICHRNYSDPNTNLHTGLLISLCKRTRARLIPKNNKPGHRILQIASLALSIHAGFITTITKPKTRLCNGLLQLSGQSSGIDAAVIVEQLERRSAPHNSQMICLKLDARKHYNNVDHLAMNTSVNKHAPHLANSATLAAGQSVTSIVTADGRAQYLTLGRSLGQGIKYSSALADAIIANVVSTSLSRLDDQNLPDRLDIKITSLADNIMIYCPVSRLSTVYHTTMGAAEDLRVTLDDERIDLNGSEANRNALENQIEYIDRGKFAKWIVRPDLTDDPDDICVLFGVPIYGGPGEQTAYDAYLERAVDREIAHAKALLDIRNAALQPPSIAADASVRRQNSRSTSRQVSSLLCSHRRCFDHIAKTTPFALVSRAFSDFDRRHHTLLRSALRLPDDLPAAALKCFNRAPSAFGIGARPVSVIATDAYTGSLTATWGLVTGITRSRMPSLLVSDLKTAALRTSSEHASLAQRFLSDVQNADLPTPPTCLIKPTDVAAVLQKNILTPLSQNKPPTRVRQCDLSRTRDYYDLQNDWFRPDTTQCPPDMATNHMVQYVRDINERNRARGASSFWLSRPTTDVVRGSRLSLPYTEAQWLVAVRRYLGYGYAGIAGCTASCTTCTCSAYRAHRYKSVFMDHRAHFHYNSCPKAAGLRNTRHDALLPITRQLCSLAQRSFQPNHNVTVNFDGVPAPDDKLMDAVIADPHNEASYWVDFHVLDPTSPSNRHIQRGSQADSQAQSSMQHSNRCAYKTKATTYHREASHHGAVLVPFIMTVVGGFTPRDPTYDAGGLLDPKDALSCLFRRGSPPARGSSRLSVEEGLIRSIAVDAVGYGRNVLYDQTLPRNAGIGRLYNQTINQMSHAVIRGTSNSTLLALRRRF